MIGEAQRKLDYGEGRICVTAGREYAATSHIQVIDSKHSKVPVNDTMLVHCPPFLSCTCGDGHPFPRALRPGNSPSSGSNQSATRTRPILFCANSCPNRMAPRNSVRLSTGLRSQCKLSFRLPKRSSSSFSNTRLSLFKACSEAILISPSGAGLQLTSLSRTLFAASCIHSAEQMRSLIRFLNPPPPAFCSQS